MASDSVEISLPLRGLEGDISIPQAKEEEVDSGTLDEPVLTTLKRDVVAVGYKFVHVVFPRRSKQLLHDWDLWGPLLLCIVLAILLQGSGRSNPDVHNPEFVEVFVIVWAGSFVVTLNSKLLGGTLSFFQSVCALGYCLMPMVGALIFSVGLDAVRGHSVAHFVFWVKFLTVLAAFAWAVFAAFAFISPSQPERRKGLALYPVFLFYFGISLMILMRTPT